MRKAVLVTLLAIAMGALYSSGSDENRLSSGQRLIGPPLLSLVRPMQNGVSSLSYGVASWLGGITGGSELLEENKRLQRQVDRLQSAMRRLEGLKSENDRLRAMLDVRQGLSYQVEGARVIGSDAGGMPRTWIVALQPNSKAGTGSFVMTERGVVGQIVRKVGRFADVLPLSDAVGRAGAVVGASGDEGVVLGDGSPYLQLEYLSPHAKLNRGDEILTSGTGKVYPRGLPIGRVARVIREKDRPLVRATVSPYESGRMLDLVLVGIR